MQSHISVTPECKLKRDDYKLKLKKVVRPLRIKVGRNSDEVKVKQGQIEQVKSTANDQTSVFNNNCTNNFILDKTVLGRHRITIL